MIVKAVLLFLIAMLALGVFGKLRSPLPKRRGRPEISPARKCAECGSYVVDGHPCARPDCPYAKP